MIVAMRRSIRVGLRAGSPLEEFGVTPDVLHRMTRRDVLDDNVDLLARAVRLIRQRPSFQLTMTPATEDGANRIVVSAASKVPSSKAGRGISRLDIYANGRPVHSVDAVDGTVPPTPVAIARESTARVAVEAQAWDHAGRLVAVRRANV